MKLIQKSPYCVPNDVGFSVPTVSNKNVFIVAWSFLSVSILSTSWQSSKTGYYVGQDLSASSWLAEVGSERGARQVVLFHWLGTVESPPSFPGDLSHHAVRSSLRALLGKRLGGRRESEASVTFYSPCRWKCSPDLICVLENLLAECSCQRNYLQSRQMPARLWAPCSLSRFVPKCGLSCALNKKQFIFGNLFFRRNVLVNTKIACKTIKNENYFK